MGEGAKRVSCLACLHCMIHDFHLGWPLPSPHSPLPSLEVVYVATTRAVALQGSPEPVARVRSTTVGSEGLVLTLGTKISG